MPEADTAACELTGRYRLDLWSVYEEVRRLYGDADVPLGHVELLAGQIEKQTRAYEVKKETVEVALALIKPEGFTLEQIDGAEAFTAEIVYPKDKESLLLSWQALRRENPEDFGFHYDPYNFDSNPEKSFFEQTLVELSLKPDDIEDIYFTGAITDPEKTDFYVEYKDEKGKYRRYAPDFVIRKKAPKGKSRGTGKVFIVEVKRERDRAHPVDGENGKKAMAVRKWENADPRRFKYHMIFTSTSTVSANEVQDLNAALGEE